MNTDSTKSMTSVRIAMLLQKLSNHLQGRIRIVLGGVLDSVKETRRLVEDNFIITFLGVTGKTTIVKALSPKL